MKSVLILLLLVTTCCCYAQEGITYPRYIDYFSAAPTAPFPITEDGKTSIYAIKLEYDNGRLVEPIMFSKNSTRLFMDFIKRHLPDLDTFPWYKFIPAVKGLPHYKVWWLHSYTPDDYHSRLYPFSSDEYDQSLRDAFQLMEGEMEPTFIAPPYSLRIYLGHRIPPPAQPALDTGQYPPSQQKIKKPQI